MARTPRSIAFWSILRICSLLLLCWDSRPAFAQGDPRHAVDRYEPAERGSDWFASDSLDLRGNARPNVGATLAYSYRSIVVRDARDNVVAAPLKNLAVAHVGGTVVLLERLRFGLSLPLQVFADGAASSVQGQALPAPSRDQGFGDLRLGADVRLFGEYRDPITMAAGAQITLPTGQQSQWISDGSDGSHVRPHVLLAGEARDVFVWAAQLSIGYRELSQTSASLGPYGSDVSGSASLGVRLKRTIVIGPEIYASTLLDNTFAKASTSAEALLGIHWLNADQFRVGAGIGRGFTSAFGSPAVRFFASAEWAPPAGPDSDGDEILDDRDACPRLFGRRRSDPKKMAARPIAIMTACTILKTRASTCLAFDQMTPRKMGVRRIAITMAFLIKNACPDRRGPRSSDPLKNRLPAGS